MQYVEVWSEHKSASLGVTPFQRDSQKLCMIRFGISQRAEQVPKAQKTTKQWCMRLWITAPF